MEKEREWLITHLEDCAVFGSEGADALCGRAASEIKHLDKQAAILRRALETVARAEADHADLARAALKEAGE